MNKVFSDLTIKSKLTLIIFSVSLLVLVIGFTYIIISDLISYKVELIEDVQLNATIIGNTCIAALAFNDHSGAEDILKNYSTIHWIEYAALFDVNRNEFAIYRSDNYDPYLNYEYIESGDVTQFYSDHLHLIKPIIHENKNYGYLYIVASEEVMDSKIRSYLGTILLLVTILIIISYFLARKLQSIISTPIIKLSKIAKEISIKEDYSIRAEKSSNDEIGSLYNGFNEMLDQIESGRQERDRAMEALSKSEEYFRAMTENTTDLTIVISDNGITGYCSPSVEKILGLSQQDLSRNTLEKWIHPLDCNEYKVAIKDSIDNPGITVSLPAFRIHHKNGCWLYLEGAATYLPHIEDLNGIVVNCREVTEKIKAENKLKDFAVRLERSNKELQDFASIASHDLQEPLRKVRAFGDRLNTALGESIPEKASDYLKRIQNAADRMQTLIDDLLAFSRVTTKALPPTPTDLNKIVAEVLSDLEIRIEELNAFVTVGDLPVVTTDALQMRQLIQNLVGNALKFHKPGVAPHVKIYSPAADDKECAKDPNSSMCRIVIEDNGIGFDQKYSDRIFTIFQRLHGRDEYEGTGIGLAICRKIIERHGGSIVVKSHPGKGAKFIISLPKQIKKGDTDNESQFETDYHLAG
ncbi:MAG: ATP-binding protein [Candidatus Zixiibacteriota bacterium]